MRWVAMAVGLSAVSAWAQVPRYLPFKMLNTAQDPFEYYVDGRSASPGGLSILEYRAATERAFRQWEDVGCAATAFRSLGLTTASIPEVRDPFDIYNVSSVWIGTTADPYYGYTLGSSDVTAMSLMLSYAGVLRQCDIYLNGAQRTWSTAASTPAAAVDLESVLLHEVGHCQGLDHSYDSEINTSDDVMFAIVPMGQAKRTLTVRDQQALCARYPQSGAVGSPCLADGGCSGTMKCATPPAAGNGQGTPMCTVGCSTGQNGGCAMPYACQPSSLFSLSYDGACLPPGDFVTQVGRPCSDHAACGSSAGMCVLPTPLPSGAIGWKDGYCSQACGPGQPSCPVGSECLEVGGLARCLKLCRAGSGDCRPGYACAPTTTGLAGVCLPACQSDADCGGLACRVCDGVCLSTQTPSALIGDRCTVSDQCGTGQVCGTFGASDAGLCTQSCGTTCASCPSGTSCHSAGPGGELFCLRDCVSGTCPAGLHCAWTATGRGCLPSCQSDLECPVGQACTSGECRRLGEDAGCSLCIDGGDLFDGGGKGGAGGGSTGGCGCRTIEVGSLGSWVLWGALCLRRRRKTFR